MPILPIDPKLFEAAHKDRLRKQMHHDLCVLSAGSANVAGGIAATAERAMLLSKELWHQVMKEIP